MAAPKWFYDARGSELFEQITRLPEYYPTRAERAVLAAYAPDIVSLTGAKTLIELGSGSSEKTRLLLDAFTRQGGLGTFVPLDVSVSALRGSTAQIAADYPGLRVRGIVGTSPGNWTGCPPAVAGWWCSSAAPSAICCPPSGPSS
ncbi:L-histidine N(alpha)-methyltransferase [Micromonospora sp. M12]